MTKKGKRQSEGEVITKPFLSHNKFVWTAGLDNVDRIKILRQILDNTISLSQARSLAKTTKVSILEIFKISKI